MPNEPLIEEQLTESVIGAYYDVYNSLGFGFLEQVYTMALERELRARGHAVSREVYVSVRYKDEELCKQRIDMIVDDRCSSRRSRPSCCTSLHCARSTTICARHGCRSVFSCTSGPSQRSIGRCRLTRLRRDRVIGRAADTHPERSVQADEADRADAADRSVGRARASPPTPTVIFWGCAESSLSGRTP